MYVCMYVCMYIRVTLRQSRYTTYHKFYTTTYIHVHCKYIHTVHTRIHTYIYTVHTYMHTYIHPSIQRWNLGEREFLSVAVRTCGVDVQGQVDRVCGQGEDAILVLLVGQNIRRKPSCGSVHVSDMYVCMYVSMLVCMYAKKRCIYVCMYDVQVGWYQQLLLACM